MAEEIAPDERPEWLPEKFKSPEDMARSYTELESAHGRLRSEAETQREQFSAALAAIEDDPQPQQQGQWNPHADPMVAAYQRAGEEGDGATQLATILQLQQAQLEARDAQLMKILDEKFASATTVDKDVTLRLAEQQVAPQFGDEWADLAPKVTERLRGRNDLLPQVPTVEGYAAALAEQAKLVRYETLEAQAKALEAERQAKLQAQTLGGGLARTPTDTDAKKAEWDEVKNADLQSYQRMVSGG